MMLITIIVMLSALATYWLILVINFSENDSKANNQMQGGFAALSGYVTVCEPRIIDEVPPVVRVPDFGTFRGSVTISLTKNRSIYQFLGLPYALPPMGLLRFKAPVPISKLNTDVVYDATHFKSRCPQLVNDEDFMYLKQSQEKSEDCLYLNVYTIMKDDENRKPLLPVMVYIHGGGYYQNSAVEHCPNYLLDHDIILVTVQYRLGPLGFLNFETDDVPGNMGLLDTVEALEWVNKYIKYFGGDNERVTIAGQSSGAVSVSLMLVSPLVKPGLFQQAIIQSGNFFGDFSLDMHSKIHAFEFARKLNCSDMNISNLTACLQKVPPFSLVMAHNAYRQDRIIKTSNVLKEIGICHAVVQTSDSTRAFLLEDPKVSMKNGRFLKIPIMTGVTKDEGSMLISEVVNYVLKPALAKLSGSPYNESFYLKNEFFHDFLQFIGADDDIEKLEMLKDSYLPDEVCSEFDHTVPGLVDLGGAIILKTAVLKLARYMREYAPTYLYSFNFKGRKTKLGYGKPVEHMYLDGVAHSDELLYLFPDYRDPSLTKDEEKTVIRLSALWASFVINGRELVTMDDLPQWPPMNTSVGPYLQIGTKVKVKQNFLHEYRNYDTSVRTRNSARSLRIPTVRETLLEPVILTLLIFILYS